MDDFHRLEVPNAVIILIRKKVEEVQIAKDNKLKWCPTPECNSVIKKPGCCKRRAICTKCGNDMCFKCNSKWHEGLPCQTMNFKEWEKNHLNYKSCPNCMTPIEKAEGCNHMECNSCHTHFCWMCKADITDTKYDHFNREPGEI